MRLGGPVYVSYAADPEAWANAHREAGYSAAYVPLKPDDDDATVRLLPFGNGLGEHPARQPPVGHARCQEAERITTTKSTGE